MTATKYPRPTDHELAKLEHWMAAGTDPLPDNLRPALRWLTHVVMPAWRHTGEFEGVQLPPWNFFDLLYDPLTGLLRDFHGLYPDGPVEDGPP